MEIAFTPSGQPELVTLDSGSNPSDECATRYPQLGIPGAWVVSAEGVLHASWEGALRLGPDAAQTGSSLGPYNDESGAITPVVPAPDGYGDAEVVPRLTVDLEWSEGAVVTHGNCEWVALEPGGSEGHAGYLLAWGRGVALFTLAP